jgi:hypothetical protein
MILAKNWGSTVTFYMSPEVYVVVEYPIRELGCKYNNGITFC